MTLETTRILEGKGFAVFSISPKNFDEISDTLRLIGTITGHVDDAARVANALIDKANGIKVAPHAPTVYYEASSDPIWTSGTDTYAGDVIRRAGGKNIFKGGWEQVDWEVILERDPDIILVAHRKKERLPLRAGWDELKAVKAGHIFFVNENWFNIPSPRLLKGLEEASRIFHETNQ
jgi:iron complex transport system substrate-binding protein